MNESEKRAVGKLNEAIADLAVENVRLHKLLVQAGSRTDELGEKLRFHQHHERQLEGIIADLQEQLAK